MVVAATPRKVGTFFVAPEFESLGAKIMYVTCKIAVENGHC